LFRRFLIAYATDVWINADVFLHLAN